MDDKHVGYMLKSINDKLKANADADLKRHDLTMSQTRVLVFLNSKNGAATQKEIEDFLGVSHPTVVGLVARMEQNGFLTSSYNKGDSRSKTVSLTQRALSLSREMEETVNANEKNMLKSLSAEEIESLKRMLTVIRKNLG